MSRQKTRFLTLGLQQWDLQHFQLGLMYEDYWDNAIYPFIHKTKCGRTTQEFLFNERDV